MLWDSARPARPLFLWQCGTTATLLPGLNILAHNAITHWSLVNYFLGPVNPSLKTNDCCKDNIHQLICFANNVGKIHVKPQLSGQKIIEEAWQNKSSFALKAATWALRVIWEVCREGKELCDIKKVAETYVNTLPPSLLSFFFITTDTHKFVLHSATQNNFLLRDVSLTDWKQTLHIEQMTKIKDSFLTIKNMMWTLWGLVLSNTVKDLNTWLNIITYC